MSSQSLKDLFVSYQSLEDLISAVRVHVLKIGGRVVPYSNPQYRHVGFMTEVDSFIFYISLIDLKRSADNDIKKLMCTIHGQMVIANCISHQHGFDVECNLCTIQHILDI